MGVVLSALLAGAVLACTRLGVPGFGAPRPWTVGRVTRFAASALLATVVFCSLCGEAVDPRPDSVSWEARLVEFILHAAATRIALHGGL